MKRGDSVKVADSSSASDYRGMVGVVRGVRPDGLVVVEFSNGMRRPIPRDELGAP